jgi:hypothetical protein
MSLGAEQEAFAKDVVLLLTEGWRQGFEIRLGEVLRPIEMQELYVKSGRSKTLDSQHIKKCAIDLILLRSGIVATYEEIKPLGKYWESINVANRWGGSWRGAVESGKSQFVDAPHFERMT